MLIKVMLIIATLISLINFVIHLVDGTTWDVASSSFIMLTFAWVCRMCF